MNIDRIARQMTDVEPSPGLEARIRARLDEAQPRARTSAWWLWRVGAPVAATAAIALLGAAQVSRGLGVQESRSPGVPGSSGPAVQESRGPGVPESRGPRVQESWGPGSRVAQLSPEEVAWFERRIPALDPVTALQIDGISVNSIQPEPLAITPLTMTALPTDGGSGERHDNR